MKVNWTDAARVQLHDYPYIHRPLVAAVREEDRGSTNASIASK